MRAACLGCAALSLTCGLSCRRARLAVPEAPRRSVLHAHFSAKVRCSPLLSLPACPAEQGPRVPRRLCDRGCKPSSEGGAAAARSEDVVRNVFDVLCAAPAVFALDAESPSWCQWETEVPRVGRKRSAAAVSGALSPTGTPRWADAASQRRAFSEAWLSFLRLELPLDIYKVRTLFECPPARRLWALALIFPLSESAGAVAHARAAARDQSAAA